MPVLLDQWGRPFLPTKDPRSDATSAAIKAMIRPAWMQAVSPGMGPEKLARILRDLQNGSDCQDFLTLADDMEDRDPHYYSLLQTRRLAIAGARLQLDTGDDESEQAQHIADETWRYLVNTPEFEAMIWNLGDALGKGFSVVQLEWDATTRPYWSVKYTWEDPRKFRFDKETQTQILVRDLTSEGVDLEPGRFIVHYNGLRSGPPLKSALARVAAVTWMFKNFTVRDWVAFAEVYGMPLRVATYDPNVMTEPEIADLRLALANMGHDAAGLVPKGVELDIHDVNRGSSGGPFKDMSEYWDKQLSKAVLGQTMTSDDGASLAQSQTHEKVRQDYARADTKRTCATVQNALIRPWVLLNFGMTAPVPTLCETPPDEDLEVFTKAVQPWVAMGLKVSAQDVRERLGVVEPVSEEDAIGGPPVDPNQPDPNAPPPPDKKAKPGAQPAPNRGAQPAHLPQSLQTTEDLAAALSDQWERLLDPYRQVIERVAANARDYDDFIVKLEKATAKMDVSSFVRQLAITAMQARGIGEGRPT